jgi:hypothetical protein
MISCCSCWSQPRKDATKSCTGITVRSLRELLGAVFGHFYEAARQVTPLVVADSIVVDKPPVSARPLQPAKGDARTGQKSGRGVKLSFPAETHSEVTHPFMRALRGTSRAGARYDPTEESRNLRDGSHQRPSVRAR